MFKKMRLLSLATAFICLSSINAEQLKLEELFAGLTEQIVQSAEKLTKNITEKLPLEKQIQFLNSLGSPFLNVSPDAIVQCLKSISTDADFSEPMSIMQEFIPEIMNQYMLIVEGNIVKNKINLTQEEFEEKMTKKLEELFIYIYSLCYKSLYKTLTKDNSNDLKVMFDENGIIPQEKRTMDLPKPE